MKITNSKSRLNKLLLLIFLAFGVSGCQDNKSSESEAKTGREQFAKNKATPSFYASGIPVYEKFDELEPLLKLDNDTTYVINFWATWCKPCIKEIPYFKELEASHKDQKLKVVMISLDFPQDVETKLVAFARDKQIESNVVVLLDGKYNDWIDKVSPDWSGAIPATYIYNRKRNELFQRPFENTGELIDIVRPFL